MLTIDVVSSAYVGGSTGKSLLTHMRAAYRFDTAPDDGTTTIVIVDLSHGSALYDTIGVLFGRDVNIADANIYFSCYYFNQTTQNDNGKVVNFIAFRPKDRFINDGQDLANIFGEIQQALNTSIFPNVTQINHIICETNLPQKDITNPEIATQIQGLWQDHTINLWSTWNTSGLLSQAEYAEFDAAYEAINDMGINWYHVHNPFSTTTGMPEDDISLFMKACYDLPASETYYSPQQLKDACYTPAYTQALYMNSTNEAIWQAAYKGFQTRPQNLLCVYKRTYTWGRIYLTRFHYYNEDNQVQHYRVNEPNDFPNLMAKLTDGVYTIFYDFFAQIEGD